MNKAGPNVILGAYRADDDELGRVIRMCDVLRNIIERAIKDDLFKHLVELRDHKGTLIVVWAVEPKDYWMHIVNKCWEDENECIIVHHIGHENQDKPYVKVIL